ncbi:MAG: Fe-S cluster assembly protein SufD [Actinomycetota bacterium]|nr:Fe-S cluster assembly protein SufD [Actinomycetota bacterium]
MPSEAEEIWRYSRIDDLDLDAYRPPAAAAETPTAPDAIPRPLEALVDASGPRSGLIVAHNGRVVHIDVEPALAAKGLVVVDGLALDDGDDLVGSVAPSSTDSFTELNVAFLTSVPVVRVPRGLDVPAPVFVYHWVDADGLAHCPRTIVQAGADSEITVVEHQAGLDVTGLVDSVVELDVAEAARVRYLNIQDLGPRIWQIAYQGSRVGRDATLQSSVVALGGDYARTRSDSSITGQGGTSYLTAVYFADGRRMHDFRTVQDHAAPSSTSDLLFKGAVQDRGESVYSGLIRVRKEARGTNAFQTNRNLVLSEGAEAKSVPNLEIETDDVRCSHASAVGPIDEEQRFYLESRGVPPAVAERLIVLGFFAEVLDRLPIPSLVGSIRAAVAGRLQGPSGPAERATPASGDLSEPALGSAP